MLLTEEQQRARDYLARKGTQAPVAKLRAQLREAFESIERALDDVPEDARDRAPAPGKWSPRRILDHLVLSHEPAVPQLAIMLAGENPEQVAIPAGLQSDILPEWPALRARMNAMHAELLRLVDNASDDASLEPKAVIEMVVKAGSEPLHWLERMDWKANVQALRMHTIEHRAQLLRALSSSLSS